MSAAHLFFPPHLFHPSPTIFRGTMCALVEHLGAHQPSRLPSSSALAAHDAQYASAGARPSTVKATRRGSASLDQPLQCPILLPETTALHKMPRGVMSLSLGKDAQHHDLAKKAQASRRAGHDGIEIHFEDLENTARALFDLSPSAKPSPPQLCSAASRIRAVCDEQGLIIICLEPFLHYPGMLPISKRDQRLRDEIPVWFAVSDILGTDVIQIASTMFGGEGVATGDEDRVVEDLRLLAQLGLAWRGVGGLGPPRPKFWAYEAMCFGAYVTTWEQAWKQVQLVDRPNFGLVIDTFQILGACYADPSSLDGKADNADAELDASVARLISTFGGDSAQARSNRQKVFFVQLGDGAKMETPLTASHPLFDAKIHSNFKMAWARTNRKFQGEGYMPCNRVAKAFIETCGWRGWLSAEYFNEDQVNVDDDYPEKTADRCMRGHEFFLNSVGTHLSAAL